MSSDDRSSYVPYTPGSKPKIGNRSHEMSATWREFIDIAYTLFDMDRPAAVALSEVVEIPVDDPPDHVELFVEPDSAFVNPPAQFDPETGIWSCTQEGLYQISISLRVPAFPTPPEKSYYGEIVTYYVPIVGSSDIFSDVSGGVDSFPITITTSFMRPFNQGDQMRWEAGIYHENATGTVECNANLQIIRISGSK